MTLEINTYGGSLKNASTVAKDPENFPGIEVSLSSSPLYGESFMVESTEDDQYETVIIARGKTREEAIASFEKFIERCTNALEVLRTIKHSPIKQPNFNFPNFPMERPEYYAGQLYTNLDIDGPGQFALVIGRELFDHQQKWSTE